MSLDQLDEIYRLRKERDTAIAGKSIAYTERNACVAVMVKMALALGFKAGVKRTAIGGWDEEWNNCAWIDFPNGQASWHYHDSDAQLFEGIPEYLGAWDGHTTEQKYAMLKNLLVSENSHPVRGLHYVHVIGYNDEGEEVQLWAGEMNQLPHNGDRMRLHTGGESYRLLWVSAVAWPLFKGKDDSHGEAGQPYIYVHG